MTQAEWLQYLHSHFCAELRKARRAKEPNKARIKHLRNIVKACVANIRAWEAKQHDKRVSARHL